MHTHLFFTQNKSDNKKKRIVVSPKKKEEKLQILIGVDKKPHVLQVNAENIKEPLKEKEKPQSFDMAISHTF